MDQKNIECIVLSIKGYDMVQVYNECLTTMTRGYSYNKPVGYEHTKHLWRVYQYAYNRSACLELLKN
jgi:hypothetical protein